jgi:hypothetical protein
MAPGVCWQKPATNMNQGLPGLEHPAVQRNAEPLQAIPIERARQAGGLLC